MNLGQTLLGEKLLDGRGGGDLNVSLVLALVQQTRVWALDLDWDQAEQLNSLWRSVIAEDSGYDWADCYDTQTLLVLY